MLFEFTNGHALFRVWPFLVAENWKFLTKKVVRREFFILNVVKM